ncbi:CIA30 family protein [Rubrivirga sp. IMCC45206]|uniref:CIA30 family protein n=1 Tax=Rubrivirga sp. IMCC45206 TaxID=3391614 RepID=UPI0039901BDA
MHVSLLLLAVAMAACAAPQTAPPADTAMTLFEFESPDAAWAVENDGVMGGRSQGFAEVVDGTLMFTGEVVTEGGGFTSVRGERQANLSDYDGIELRIRGGGRTFELDVDDGTRHRGREVNRQGAFPTAADWQTVRVPFADLDATAHGEPVTVDALDRSAIRTLGIYIADGIDGPFRLEVDWIRAYRDDA